MSTGEGALPPGIAVTPGETLTITATGDVNCCDTATSPGLSGPNGFSGNPFGGSGSSISNSTGSGVGSFNDPTGSFPLTGVFTGGGAETPFVIGASDTITVPAGVTELYFGLPDGAGFGGASGYYGDNSGAFTVTIAAVPEPAEWMTMLVGLFSHRRLVAAPAAASRARGLRSATHSLI